MKRLLIAAIPGISLLGLSVFACGCSGHASTGNNFPDGFDRLDDAAKMAWIMQHAPADSVARFICDAALGRVGDIRIDTLSMAALYAYENYRDEDLQTFQTAFDTYADSLPLPEKMRLRKLAANDNPASMGYQLGLEYVNDIRSGSKNAADVEDEIKTLRDECLRCPDDSLTFKRFMTGFKVALDQDGSYGVPAEIYEKYK